GGRYVAGSVCKPEELQEKRRGSDVGAGRSGQSDGRFSRGGTRNQTHASTTDEDAMLARKGAGKEAKLSYSGHVLMENRNGLVAEVEVLQANGTEERDVALVMIEKIPGDRLDTIGAHNDSDTEDLAEETRN